MDTDEGKGEKKELTDWGEWWTWRADMLHVDANECKKKRRRKKTYLEWGHADVNVLRADSVACRWCCVRMPMSAKKKEKKERKNLLGHANANALRADALYGDMDGGSCRVGADECREKTKKKTY